MGKAGTWIRNLMFGRRTENHKKIKDTPFSEEHSATPTIFSGTLKESRQRWSFRRWSLSRTENGANKSTRSFNSIGSGQLEEDILFMEYKKDPKKDSSTASSSATSPTAAQVRKMFTIAIKIPAAPQSGLAQTAFVVSAATRIQAAYRSYLARRALRALRGLVKLQALVRGNLVRKRTNAILKSLHALISIQVRARIQRTQAVDQDIVYLNSERGLATQNIQHREGFIIETDYPNIIKSQRKHNNNRRGHHNDNQHISRTESGFFSSEKVSGDHQVPVSCCSLSEQFTTTSSRFRNSQINNIVESQRISGQHHDLIPFVIPAILPAKSSDHILYHDDYPWLPNYMCNTESSKAKVRSHSEPKQRPKRSIKEKTSRRSLSNNRMEVLMQNYQPRLQHVSFHARPHAQKKKLIKLYRSTKHVMDDELSDSASTITS